MSPKSRGRSIARAAAKNSAKNFGTVGITCHSGAVWMPVWTTCNQTPHYCALFFTTQPKSTMRSSPAPDCPHFTHTRTRMPRWADTPLSPMCTCPNTVAPISSKFLLRRRHLGTHRFSARRAPLSRAMSPRSISFQVEAESSTVVHRQPLRSWHASGRRGARHRETAG
jgi:hypothetical protein